MPVSGPFDRIGVDVVQFPKSARGSKYAIVFDYLTKWVEAFPTPALTIARLLVSEKVAMECLENFCLIAALHFPQSYYTSFTS